MRHGSAAALVCLALAVLHTWPIAAQPWRNSLNYNADAQQGAWTLAWIAHTLPRDPAHLFDGNIFAPERHAIAFSEPMITPALIGAPVWWLTGAPVLTYNLVLLAGLSLTAWCAWFVIWKWTKSFGAGLVAASLTAFNPHLMTRLPHIMAAHAWGLPLIVYLVDRLMEQPNRRDALLLSLVVASVAMNSIYWLALAAVIVTAGLVVNGTRARAGLVIAGAAAAGLLIVSPALLPYVELARGGSSRPLESVAQFSATPSGYLVSLSRLHAAWTARFFDHNDVNVFFAGFTGLSLAATGVVAAWRAGGSARRRAIMLTAIAAAGVLLSLGPATAIYRGLYHALFPLRGLRAAARFGYLYLLVVALAAGLGVDRLERRWPPRRRVSAAAAIALALVTLEIWQSPIRTMPFTGVPAVYSLLADSPSPVMLVEVPFYPPEAVFENGEYVINATAHWRPLMNGTSGVTPMSYRRRAESFWYFPRDWAVDAIKKEGATHVMVHLEKFGREAPDVLRGLEQRSDLRFVGGDTQGHRLYAIVR